MTLQKVIKFIKEKDNFFVVTDSDPDGICSGYQLNTILKKLNKSFKIVIRKGKKRGLKKDIIEKFMRNNYPNIKINYWLGL